MNHTERNYKAVYLWFYAINVSLCVALIILKHFDMGSYRFFDWAQTGICCFGVYMLLSLWGRAFISNSNYKGKFTLSSRITRLFTFSLAIIEAMVVYYASFNHPSFLKVCCVSLIIWISGFGIAAVANKDFITRRATLPLEEK